MTEPSSCGPCRRCGRPSWLEDENGAVHPCCKFWMGEEGHRRCDACAVKVRGGWGLREARSTGQ
jgi:hypothetical protein